MVELIAQIHTLYLDAGTGDLNMYRHALVNHNTIRHFSIQIRDSLWELCCRDLNTLRGIISQQRPGHRIDTIDIQLVGVIKEVHILDAASKMNALR